MTLLIRSQLELRHGRDLHVWVSEQSLVVGLLRQRHELPQGLPVLVWLVKHPVVEQVQACGGGEGVDGGMD